MKKLPVNNYEGEIINAVENNNVVILTAETGSGKSTQVPQMLMRYGYEVVITQPRRIAARTVAKRVAMELGCNVGETVGFMTAFEKEVSEETKILFCTDGLQLVREVTKSGIKIQKSRKVLIIDEVHEWNLNIEVLIAWCKLMLDKGIDMKVIVMSATLEAEKLSYFFEKAKIINIPGSLYEVKTRLSSGNIIADIYNLVEEKRNVLVFQPGKKEIAEVIDKLDFLKDQAIVLPLHGEMEIEDQNKCFIKYAIPKVIIATNVAQTSITIPDIDAVVDSATEKRVEVINGIESLITANISQSDSLQRKGRAGRVKPGIYIYASDTPYEELKEFSVPEINRLRLDQIVLRLASIDIDAEELNFFHQPSIDSIRDSKNLLKSLGALSKEGKITRVGMEMSRFPTSVRSARMLVEARKRGVYDDMVDIVSIYEAGGIKSKSYMGVAMSEFVVQLRIFRKINEKIKKLKESGRQIKDLETYEKEKLYHDVNRKSYYKALEIRRKIKECSTDEIHASVEFINETEIEKACIVGLIDNIFFSSFNGYINSDDDSTEWRIDNKSSVYKRDIVVGLPKIISFKNRFGVSCSMNLITWPINVSLDQLHEIDPERFPISHKYRYSSYTNSVYKVEYIVFDEHEKEVSEIEVDLDQVIEEFPHSHKYEYDQYEDCVYAVEYVIIGDYEKEISREMVSLSEKNYSEIFSETLATFLAQIVIGEKDIDYCDDDIYLKRVINHNRCYSVPFEKLKNMLKKNIIDLNVKGLSDFDEYIYEFFMV